MASRTEVLGHVYDHRKEQLRPMADAEESNGRQPAREVLTPNEEDVAPGAFEHGGKPANEDAWSGLVARLQTGDSAAMAELYNVFAKGIRFYLCRQLGPQEIDDRVHDAFVIVLQSIQRGELRDPRRLMGFVRTVVRRMVAAQIDREIHHRKETLEPEFGNRVVDNRSNPEKSVILRQKIELIREVLDGMSGRDREILYRFYVDEQPPEQICREMQLSITQFRLLKSRAKSRFGEMGRKKLQVGAICEDSVRTFVS